MVHPLAEWISKSPATQAQLAREAHCSESHLCLILKGKRTPSLRLAQRLSAATGVPIDSLVVEREGRQC